MKTKLYLKSTFTDIKHSLGRFIAVVLIILMGVLLFVGIKSVGPNLEVTADNYFDKTNLSDLQIISTLGLTQEDEQLIESVGASVEGSYQFTFAEEEHNLILQALSYEPHQKQNKLKLAEGRLPKNNKEVVIDKELKGTYNLGETINIKSENITNEAFKIVGFVETSLYMDVDERGISTIGDGTIDGFVYLLSDVFQMDSYTMMYVRLNDLPLSMNSFSEEYQSIVDEKAAAIKNKLTPRSEERLEQIKTDALTTIDKEEAKLKTNQKNITDGIAQIKQAQSQLATQKEALEQQLTQLVAVIGEQHAQQQLSAPFATITQQSEELSKQLASLEDNQAKVEEGLAQINEEKATLAELKPATFMINDRQSNPGFMEYQSLSERIDAIANVFPVFFFAIAILITFTTITRMVEENRREIGTLKALGYRNIEIASKYIVYTLLAATIGTSLGVVIGSQFLPTVVFTMQEPNNIFKNYTTHYFFWPIVIAIVAALVSTLGSALYVLAKDLHEKPTSLLMGKAPKAGKRVFLERLTFLWRRLNFFQKVTYRNIFRYKARMILTVLGIAGCTGLIIAGFGLQDSISAPVDKQFNELVYYQSIVTLDEEASTSQEEALKQQLTNDANVTDFLEVFSTQVTLKKAGTTNQTASFTVAQNDASFKQFVNLRDASSHKKIAFSDKGAFISQRLAQHFSLKKGDSFTLETTDAQTLRLKVAGIIENYLGHTIYVSSTYYETLKKDAFVANTYFLKTKQLNEAKEQTFAQDLLATGSVLNTSFISQQIKKQELASESLGAIVVILILLSGTLAFVVLYNLTNINISERERELATIKVLGFYDKEVTMHIVRENIVFTIIGIAGGFGVGRLLTWFILEMASSDLMVFPVIIKPQGYLIATIMTLFFSSIVMLVTHVKLRHINMIEALKSNE